MEGKFWVPRVNRFYNWEDSIKMLDKVQELEAKEKRYGYKIHNTEDVRLWIKTIEDFFGKD